MRSQQSCAERPGGAINLVRRAAAIKSTSKDTSKSCRAEDDDEEDSFTAAPLLEVSEKTDRDTRNNE